MSFYDDQVAKKVGLSVTLSDAVYLDDLAVGKSWTSPSFSLTAENIISFAEQFDPQPMHVDMEAAASGRFGTIIASGWHVAALAMREFVKARPFGSSLMLGVSVNNLQWLRPVVPGDTLISYREVTHIRSSRTRADRGMISIHTVVTNQSSEKVLVFDNVIQLPRRSGVGTLSVQPTSTR